MDAASKPLGSRAKLKATAGLVAEDASQEEAELIKRKRAVIVTFNGIFRFSKDLALNCIPCDVDLPESTLQSLDEDVNAHTTSMEHLLAWSSFVKRESDGINKLLSSAIQDGVFVAVCDGYVRCNVCNNVISDSLAFLKRHLFNEKHRFKGAPLPMEAVGTYANPYGQAARKLTSLVSANADLQFATDKGQLFVNCIKCEKLMLRGYSEVSRHLKSKMHTSDKRKKRMSEGEEGGEEGEDYGEDVITLSDDEQGGGGLNSSGEGVEHRRKKARITSSTSPHSTRSRSLMTRKINTENDGEVSSPVRKTRGGVSRVSKISTSTVVQPVRKTFGRGRPPKNQHHLVNQNQQPQLQTATIEMTTADGTTTTTTTATGIAEGQTIILMAENPAVQEGEGEEMDENDPQNLQNHHHHQQPRYTYIEVLHEEQVEFVDGEGNSHTATVLGSVPASATGDDGQPTTAIWEVT